MFSQQGYKSTLSYLTKWTSSVNNSTNNDIHSRHVAAEDTINVYGDDSDSKSLLYIDEEEYDYIMCNFKTDNVIWSRLWISLIYVTYSYSQLHDLSCFWKWLSTNSQLVSAYV